MCYSFAYRIKKIYKKNKEEKKRENKGDFKCTYIKWMYICKYWKWIVISSYKMNIHT